MSARSAWEVTRLPSAPRRRAPKQQGQQIDPDGPRQGARLRALRLFAGEGSKTQEASRNLQEGDPSDVGGQAEGAKARLDKIL